MKTTISVHNFRQAFQDCNRQDNFSYNGLTALFEWLEDYEDSCGEEIELDVIALCCDFSEFDSALDCISECGYDFTPEEQEDKDAQEEEAIEWLHDNTMLITFDGGVIIQGF